MRNEDNHELIKKVLLETMDEFHKFCEDNNLTYYLVGGGLIGAIRHKGLIPWDDDLDVIMPEKDFKKLISLHSEFKPPLRLNNYFLDNSYYRCCAALINDKLIVDTGSVLNNETGVTLDILCLYPTFDSTLLTKAHFKSVKLSRALLIIKGKVFLRDKYSKPVSLILNSSHQLMKFLPKSLIIKQLNFFENIKIGKAHNLGNLHGAWGAKEVMTKDMLADRELYEFENRQYWSMSRKNVDTWLTNVYGDYMTLPPEEKRVFRHIEKVIKVSEEI